MSLEELILTYGYIAIAIGAFLEGETILILGGFAAHRGYLDLSWVLVSAFLGTLLGDQLYFYIGRAKGKSFLENKARLRDRSEKVFVLLNKNEILLILGFRFLYGLRIITPFLLGASGISSFRFLFLNIIGAFIWATIIGIMGYLFGHALEFIIGDIKRYEGWIFSGLVVLGGVIWSIHIFSERKKSVTQVTKLKSHNN